MAKRPKKKKIKSPKKKKIRLYSNLVNSRQAKKDARLKKRAKYLASLPKHPVKRLIYRLNPRHFFGWLFSKDGLRFIGKAFAVCLVAGILLGVGTFLYFRKDVNTLRPGEISRQVVSTVNNYYDRHGKLLWEDKGEGNYTLVVSSENISKIMKDATVAVEDKTFYEHRGVSLSGILRAIVNNFSGRSTQGGSTLTQQLVKQVFFADEAHKRGLDGIPRKIKEVILATEIERLYNKDQIITMYLNESPYGGRRNGVESAAQDYFGKTAKDLNLAEAALLAAIPNNPSVYNPYNIDGNDALIARQHKVLDDMVSIGAVSKKEAEAAKKVAILDTIRPEVSQLANIKAPHFVLEARKVLEEKLGVKTVRAGGLSVTTTLDLEIQEAAEAAAADGAKMIPYTGANNLALSAVDVDTAQVIAMVGSVDFNKPGYGQRNAATSNLEPGSSIKPIVDFAPLFMQREGVNYGPGSILRDENIDKIYCGGNTSGRCTLRNFTGGTYGNVTIRQSLGSSLNRPAVKAMYIVGPKEAVKVARDLGNLSYCKDQQEIYLTAAIGGGCTLKPVEHTNSFASLARYGKYRPLSYILEVKNSSNEQLLAWREEKGTQVVDPQVAYMVADILSDASARSLVFGAQATSYGFRIPGVWTAAKTGTTDNGQGRAKDSWMMSFSTKIALGVWTGNHDGAPLASSSNDPVRRMTNTFMVRAHEIYAAQGKWKVGEHMAAPAGIKKMAVNGKTDIWPSWFDAKAGIKKDRMIFDRVSKKKATDCTPEAARIEIEVSRTTDPITKQEVITAADDYDPNADDDIHQCSDVQPKITNISLSASGEGGARKITVSLERGTHNLANASITIGGQSVYSGSISSNKIEIQHTFTASQQPIIVTVNDVALYQSLRTAVGPTLSSSEGD